jgi:hypothetical protein
MLKRTQVISRPRKASADLNVEIAGVATALPAHKLSSPVTVLTRGWCVI